MKKFQFRLQTVLDYRSDQLDLVQQKVAKEEAIRARILGKIREYDQMIERAFQEQQQTLTQLFDPNAASNFPNYIWRLKQLRFQEHNALQEQEQVLNIVRQELKEAMVKKKSLDLLKEKQEKNYLKQIDKDEEQFLAELTQNRFYRKQKEYKAGKNKLTV